VVSGENVQTLEGIYAGWERGDFTVGVAAFADDVTMFIDPEIPDTGLYESLEGIRGYMRQFLEPWDSLTIAAESFTDAGNTVLVKVKQSGTGKDSRIPVTLDYFHVWRFRDGAVIRLESILREETALEAAGLASGPP
jgi:ketosteroid isomerase-like protein